MHVTLKIFVISVSGQHHHAAAIASLLNEPGQDVTILYSDPNPSIKFAARFDAKRVSNRLSWAQKISVCLDSSTAGTILVISASCFCADYVGLVRACVSSFKMEPSLSVWSANIIGGQNKLQYTRLSDRPSAQLVDVSAVDFLVFALDSRASSRLRAVDCSMGPSETALGRLISSWVHKENLRVCVDTDTLVRHHPVVGKSAVVNTVGDDYFFRRNLDSIEAKFLDWSLSLLRARQQASHKNKYLDASVAKSLTHLEMRKTPKRFDIINLIISSIKTEMTRYLEIGVRNPADNFNRIAADFKFSVDPGVEFKDNPVDFAGTSDEFFDQLNSGKLFFEGSRQAFDLIFIDGLHLADQVHRDIENALNWVTDDGFIVLHDCNPPTEYHARESYADVNTPAGRYWNGTVWKALAALRTRTDLSVFCIDTDWGCGVISKNSHLYPSLAHEIGPFFYEYRNLADNRAEVLGLVSPSDLPSILNGNYKN